MNICMTTNARTTMYLGFCIHTHRSKWMKLLKSMTHDQLIVKDFDLLCDLCVDEMEQKREKIRKGGKLGFCVCEKMMNLIRHE